MRRNKGFGLIEVLVAAVIFVSLLGAVMPLFTAGLKQVKKAETIEIMLSAQQRIFHRLKTINPATDSEGEDTDNQFHYRWQTERRNDYEPQYAPEVIQRYDLALFNVSVFMNDSADLSPHAPATFMFTLIGWRDEEK